MLIFVVLTAILAVVQYRDPDARRPVFAVIVLPGVVLEPTRFVTGRPLRERRFAVVGLGVMVVAYLIWLLDQVPQLCYPNSLIQGHALWHGLSAVAAFMIVLHYRATEQAERALT
jgi:hypothetical protein